MERIKGTGLYKQMPWDSHELPFRMTQDRAKRLKYWIHFIEKMPCLSADQAYSMAGLADGFFYILKKHRMPGMLVKGPFINVGNHVARLKHYRVESKD